MLSDYNCKILNIDRYKLYLGDDSLLKNEFTKMVEDINILGSLGFHKLVCQIPYNTSVSPSYAKKHVASLKRRILKESTHRLSAKFNISVVATVYLSEDAPYVKGLDSLTLPKTNYIFLELPFSDSSGYIPSSINKILYSCKLLPIFTNFHICNALYDPDEIKKLINIKGAAFQFDLKHSLLPENINAIKQILKNGNTVLTGTSCDHSNLNKIEIGNNIKILKKMLGEEYYITLILRARSFPM